MGGFYFNFAHPLLLGNREWHLLLSSLSFLLLSLSLSQLDVETHICNIYIYIICNYIYMYIYIYMICINTVYTYIYLNVMLMIMILRLRQCGKLCPEVVPGTFQSCAWMPSATALLCPRLRGSPTWEFSGFSSELRGFPPLIRENPENHGKIHYSSELRYI